MVSLKFGDVDNTEVVRVVRNNRIRLDLDRGSTGNRRAEENPEAEESVDPETSRKFFPILGDRPVALLSELLQEVDLNSTDRPVEARNILQEIQESGNESPILLVNATRASGGKLSPDLEEKDSEAFEAQKTVLIQTIMMDMDGATEDLFGSDLAVFSTTSRFDKTLNRYRGTFPHDFFLPLNYPREQEGVAISEIWDIIKSPTGLKAVDQIKEYLAYCNRPLNWKLYMTMNLEFLGLKQYFHGLKGQKNEEGSGPNNISAPELPELITEDDEIDDTFGMKLNVLDQILAMIMERTDLAEPSESLSAEQEFERIGHLHLSLRNTWLEEFGSLPSP
eukprot:Clim_evm11s152 gene=Clim_evmTU11s152